VSARANGEAIKLARAADFDPTKKVIIEGEVNRSASSGTGSIRITHYGTESLNVMIDSTSDGWFYINDVWYPGWKAWVNGEETPVYRANGTFRAVRVPSGQHTVFMKYESTYLSLGIWIAMATWALIGIIFLFRKKRSQ
ncbi:MAG: YfhO family protein, partial [Chloroflexi bacterium]|nr:YfhO family protein [Chloroflexota bacterium]